MPPTAVGRWRTAGAGVAGSVAVCVLATTGAPQERPASHIVPLFPAASETQPEGVVRVVNRAGSPVTLEIVAIDADGVRAEGVGLDVDANETAHFDSGDLETGNADAGLDGGTGPGRGDWRLEIAGGDDIEVQAYVRTSHGAYTEMYETATRDDDGFSIPTFNPGGNVNQIGQLVVFNPSDEPAMVKVRGIDDLGESPGTAVTIELPARESRIYTAAELESGAAPGLSGALGDGHGKWRLDGEADDSVRAMSLISSPTGHLTNLSTTPALESGGVHRVPLFPPAADPLGRQGFARVVNRSDSAGEVRIEAFDDADWSYDPVTLSIGARETRHFNSNDLELGNAAKGLTGGTGAGAGDWRLELTSGLDIEVLSYVRTVGGQGYVTPMHDTAVQETDGLKRYYVPMFHPAGYEGQESRLHLLNLDSEQLQVGIDGLDDVGLAPPEGDVGLVLEPGETRVLTAGDLENGGDGLEGRFGRGTGRWRLFVTADGALQTMSLGYSADGFLANLSRGSPPAHEAPVVEPPTPPPPDLTVEAPSVSAGAPAPGASFTLSATVANRGGGDAQATTLRYYRSTNATITTTDTVVGTSAVGALAASQVSAESITLTAPGTAGTYHYGACVDAVAEESNVENNCSRAVPVTVQSVAEQRWPDLVVEMLPRTDGNPTPNGRFNVFAEVTNAGMAAAAATELRFYRSTAATITTSDTSVGMDPVGALAPSQVEEYGNTVTAPPDAGTYYYGACVKSVANESDTTNNCSPAIAVTVDPMTGPPDLRVVLVGVGQTWISNETPQRFHATVRNRGSASPPSTLRQYLSRSRPDGNGGAHADKWLVASADVPSLGPNLEASTVNHVIVPERGRYFQIACVDPVPGEVNTDNNCRVGWLLFDVHEISPDAPDLVVSSDRYGATDVLVPPGSTQHTVVTVSNAGTRPAAETTVVSEFLFDGETGVSGTGTAIPALDPGEEYSFRHATEIPDQTGVRYVQYFTAEPVADEVKKLNNTTQVLFSTWDPLDDFTIHLTSGCRHVPVCVWDHECADGDRIDVAINGTSVFNGEIVLEEQCTVAAVNLGANTITLTALNGTGYKGELCGHQNVNTASIRVGGVEQVVVTADQPGLSSTTATLTITEEGTGPCANPEGAARG